MIQLGRITRKEEDVIDVSRLIKLAHATTKKDIFWALIYSAADMVLIKNAIIVTVNERKAIVEDDSILEDSRTKDAASATMPKTPPFLRLVRQHAGNESHSEAGWKGNWRLQLK